MGFTTRLRVLAVAATAAVSIAAVAAPAVAAAGPSTSVTTAATRVVRIAEQQRGKHYAYGASGPYAFDCSGLVRYAYRQAGVSNRLGGGHSGYSMLAWGRAHHLVSRSNPQVGDVVVYGNGAHVGIYIGHGRVVSALNPRQGIRITGLHALRNPVTAYIHTQLAKVNATAVSTPAVAKAKTKAAPKAAVRTVRVRVYANLRSGDSTATRVLAVVRPGTHLHVVGSAVRSGKRWDQVTYGGHRAWIRADLVRAA